MIKFVLGGMFLLAAGCASDGVEGDPGPENIVLGTEAGQPVPRNAGTEEGSNSQESGASLEGFPQVPDFIDDEDPGVNDGPPEPEMPTPSYAGTACETLSPDQVDAIKAVSDACFDCQCTTLLSDRTAESCVAECTAAP